MAEELSKKPTTGGAASVKKPELVKMVDTSWTHYFTRCMSEDGMPIMTELMANEDMFKVITQPNKKPRLEVVNKLEEGETENNPDEEGNLNLINHVTDSILDKINNNLYIELESLCEEKKLAKEPVKKLQLNDKGEIIATREKSSTTIDCWYNSVKAYMVFAALYSRTFPSSAPGLWQHFHNITKVADKYEWEGLYNYDIKFRMAKAREAKPNWAIKDQVLWSDEVQSR